MIKYNLFLEKKNKELLYLDTDSFVPSVNTKDTINDLKNLQDLLNFSNLSENHELFSNKNKKLFVKIKMETPKSIWIDELVCLRNKMYAFNCGDDSKDNIKGVSKSYLKNKKNYEYKKCLNWNFCQKECDNYIVCSLNHEM